MARPQPYNHSREYPSPSPYQIPIARSFTTRNTSWSSSPSRSSIPLTPRSICTMCCLYTLFLVGLVCASGAVFYLVEEYVLNDDPIVTATSDVILSTPVDATTDITTECKTTKTPVKPPTTKATTTTTKNNRSTTTTTQSSGDSSSCSDSNSTIESSSSKYNISTNSSSSKTTSNLHPPPNESNYESGNSTTSDCATSDSATPAPITTESCNNDTDDSTTTVSSSSYSKTQIPAKPSSHDKDEATSTDCSTSVEDTAAESNIVGGENEAEESMGSGGKTFM